MNIGRVRTTPCLDYNMNLQPYMFYWKLGGQGKQQLALSPGHSQTLSHSRGEKLGEGLGLLLHHGPEMVDSVSANRVYVTYYITKSTISGPWHSNDPRPSPDFFPRLRDKIWEWPGDEARQQWQKWISNTLQCIWHMKVPFIVLLGRAWANPTLASFLGLHCSYRCLQYE